MTKMNALLLQKDGFAETAQAIGNRLEAPQEHLRYGTVARPTPGKGQVLIQVRRAAVNPSDVAFVQGLYGQPRRKGVPAGFEGVGKVVSAGPGLMGQFLVGRDVGFYVTPDGSGSWGEYAVTQASVALPLKKGVADRDAAGLIVNPLTAAAMLEMVKPGDAFVFSAAASQLGKLVAALAKDQGKKMIALVRRDEPVATLQSLGAARVLNETSDSYATDLATVLEREQPVIFLDAVAGMSSAVVFKDMGPRARWVVYGRLDSTPMEVIEPGELIFMMKQIEGYWTTEWSRRTSFLRKMRVFGEVQNRFRDGRWTTDVSAELPLEHAIERLPQAMAQPDGKVQIVMPGG